MRQSLKKSIADSPDPHFERYPKGSIVLCNSCAAPIYKLDAGIALGQKAGGAAANFKPLKMADLHELQDRADIDAGVRAMVKGWSLEERAAHLAKLDEPRAGAPMMCPVCHQGFAQVLSTEETETHDRGYVLELLTIPPVGLGRPAPVRGKRFAGPDGDWVH